MTEKKEIRAMSKAQLREFFLEKGDKAFRGDQVYEWLWQRNAHTFQEMTNLSKSTRDLLQEEYIINPILVEQVQRSDDGTLKSAMRLHDGLLVESVLIPSNKRSTACVSSQVGCSLDCHFCATASLKRMRNLKPEEIVDQVVALNHQSQLYYNKALSNIVFMGMGEPLMNYNSVMEAIMKITSPEGLGMAAKRITLSTSGIPKMIRKMADDNPKFRLAVSLHSAVEETRNSIMPFSQRFPLSELMESLQFWYASTGSRITFEYVVWKGINDTKSHIDALITYAKKIPCKINLIEYNPVGNDRFVQANEDAIDLYMKYLRHSGIRATIRRSRGKDISAACGQLANKLAIS